MFQVLSIGNFTAFYPKSKIQPAEYSVMAKTKWPKPPKYSVPLFNCAEIVLLREKEEAIEYLDRLGLSFDLNGFNGFAYSHHREGKAPIMIIAVFVHEPQILAHEACHIAFDICNHVGVPTPNDGMNETFCYLVQQIVSAFLPHIRQE
ncbi:hypothetical protein O1Y80_004713 [Yersinia enterocolitica]|uniref:hypothetical protein n=1 Tax=Yersinia enterocolitica TaxID=630 RepID=UPI0006822CE8|nr:hypothetical protein [Yersinia enterocolitica]EKN3396458.1 hypothetical protein [Yersinia enterocolitica]